MYNNKVYIVHLNSYPISYRGRWGGGAEGCSLDPISDSVRIENVAVHKKTKWFDKKYFDEKGMVL